VEVLIYSDEVEAPPSNASLPLSNLLSAVDWTDENENTHTEWSELSIMSVGEWDIIMKELHVDELNQGQE
jgi:hypothetical protein